MTDANIDPLDFRTRADIEYGLPGPNLRLYLLIGAIIVGGGLPLLGHPFTWLGLLWAPAGVLAGFALGYAFLGAQRSRGIPASMIGSTMLMGVLIFPSMGGILIALLRLLIRFILTLLQ